jgi:hypothetical protein
MSFPQFIRHQVEFISEQRYLIATRYFDSLRPLPLGDFPYLLGLAGCPEMDQQNGSASGGESSSSSSE